MNLFSLSCLIKFLVLVHVLFNFLFYITVVALYNIHIGKEPLSEIHVRVKAPKHVLIVPADDLILFMQADLAFFQII